MRDVRLCRISRVLLRAYTWERLRTFCLRLIRRLEGSQFHSGTLRLILREYHGVEVGAYSYGEGLLPGIFPAGVKIGRYVSIAPGVRVFLRNHPLDRLSTHPFFYNKQLGFLQTDSIETGTLAIEHDVWIGERAIITPGCARIGLGAVVGAGAVVTRDVPDFAIVAGNPTRLLKYRFSVQVQELVRCSRWWEHSVEECVRYMPDMVRALDVDPGRHPLLAEAAQNLVQPQEASACV